MFRLESVNIEAPESGRWTIALSFIARDFPDVIADRHGKGGTKTVRDSFDRIAKCLRKNLRFSSALVIELTVYFVSRPNTNPVCERVSLGTSENPLKPQQLL